MRLIVLLLAGFLSSVPFAAGYAQPHANERDYIIEVLIFTQAPGEGATELPGLPHIYLPIKKRALRIGPAPAWRKLTYAAAPLYRSQRVRLTREAAALKRSDNYRLLFHEAWRMRLVSKNRSLPLLIEGGEYFDGAPELQGILNLSVARYLHLETDLFLNTFEPFVLPVEIIEEETANNSSSTVSKVLKPKAKDDVISLIKGKYQVKDSAGMHQNRRMRSGDLHFIDSPYLGLLIKIDRAP